MLDLIPEDIRKALRFLALKIEPVGSRVTCDPPPTDTDADFLILILPKHLDNIRNMLSTDGWVYGRGSEYEEAGFESWKKHEWDCDKDTLNFIITDKPVFFDRFMEATELCKKFNFMRKRDRIALFTVVRDAPRGDEYQPDSLQELWVRES